MEDRTPPLLQTYTDARGATELHQDEGVLPLSMLDLSPAKADKSRNATFGMKELVRDIDLLVGTHPQGRTRLYHSGSIGIHHAFVEDNFVLNSLSVRNPSFVAGSAADGSHLISDITGMTLEFSVLGLHEKAAIKSIAIRKDARGNDSWSMQIDNPLSPAVEKIFNSASVIPLTIAADSRGKVVFPANSEIYYSLAKQSGVTLPGMVLADAFQDAGDIMHFMENHADWANNTMAPFVRTFSAYIRSSLDSPDNARTASSGLNPGQTDSTRQVAAAPGIPGRYQRMVAGGDYSGNMQIEGRDRTFAVHVPAGYDGSQSLPLVVLAHGLGQTGAELQDLIGANKLADKEHFIAVYPDSVNWFNINGLRIWETGNGLTVPGQHTGDVQFVSAIIQSMKQKLNVDPRRVYMAGLSNGGMLTYRAAGELSGTLAGIAIISSAMSGKEPPPKEPLSLIDIHGTADEIIPYKGLSDVPSVLSDIGLPVFQPDSYAADFYKRLDHIASPYSVTRNGNEIIETASSPQNGTAVERITILGGGHIPNNRTQLLQQAWDFLKAHPKPAPPNSADDNLRKLETSYENWTTVRQLEAAVKQRGVNGIEQDVDNVFDAMRTLPDGSLSPARIYDAVYKATQLTFGDPVSRFVRDTKAISKQGDNVFIDRASTAAIPINIQFGIGKLQSLEVGKVSFVLNKCHGLPQLHDINGVTLHTQIAGIDLSSRIEDITELPDVKKGSTGRIYQATMQNPLPGWMRTAFMSPAEFNVSLRLNADFTPVIIDEDKTRQQLLGNNPWVNGLADEAQDVINMKQNPGLANAAKLTADVVITGGLIYLGTRIRRGVPAKLAGTIGFVAAPAVIGLIDKEFNGRY